MPVLRGIEVKLVTFPARQIIEEYPHPDGSSVRLVTRQEAASTFAEGLSTASSSPSVSGPAVPSRKVDPKSSVYIATQPGSQFIIAYDINKVPEACRYMNFKVFINGRHIVTCGRDLEERHKGVISRTLWAPSDQLGAWAGIEGRQFMFLRDETAKSAAEDGRLIEVQVHRAEARTSCAPALSEFRQPRQYGIATPSTGLIDKPQEVEWYKYRLIDPIDIPYVKFFFHYRSLESLKELNLIPEEELKDSTHSPEQETRRLPKPAPEWEIRQLPKPPPEKEIHQLPKQESPDQVKDVSRSSTPESSFLWLDGAGDDRPVAKSLSRSGRQDRTQSTGPPVHDALSRRRENATAPFQASRTPLPTLGLQRPLPNLPLDPVARTRVASKSPAPSLTPSLKRSVDDGDFDDDIEIAEPKVVRYNKVHEKPTLLEVASARNSVSTFGRPSSGTNVPARSSSRHSSQPAVRTASGYESDSSGTSRWSDVQAPEYPTALAPRPQLSYAQRRAQEQSHQPTSSGPEEHASRPQVRPRADEMMQGLIRQEQRRPPQPLSNTVPSYRGTDTTMQSQVQRSPQRQGPAGLQLSPQTLATYTALRDLGNQMLSGETFRRRSQARSTTGQGPESHRLSPTRRAPESRRPTQMLSPHSRDPDSRRHTEVFSPTRRDPARNSTQSWSSRHSGSSTTPATATLSEQRWSPRNAPPDPQTGVSWEEFVRQSPRHDPVIDRMIDELNRSDRSKENRPPPER